MCAVVVVVVVLVVVVSSKDDAGDRGSRRRGPLLNGSWSERRVVESPSSSGYVQRIRIDAAARRKRVVDINHSVKSRWRSCAQPNLTHVRAYDIFMYIIYPLPPPPVTDDGTEYNVKRSSCWEIKKKREEFITRERFSVVYRVRRLVCLTRTDKTQITWTAGAGNGPTRGRRCRVFPRRLARSTARGRGFLAVQKLVDHVVHGFVVVTVRVAVVIRSDRDAAENPS